jgi:hypothetical protein
MDELNELAKDELLELLWNYDNYLQEANDLDLFATGWRPISIIDYYHGNFGEEDLR